MPPRKNLVSCSWMEFGKCTHFKHFPNYASISSQNVVSSVKSWKKMKITNVREQRDNGFALVTGKELFLLYQFLKPKSSFNENGFESPLNSGQVSRENRNTLDADKCFRAQTLECTRTTTLRLVLQKSSFLLRSLRILRAVAVILSMRRFRVQGCQGLGHLAVFDAISRFCFRH